MNTRSLLRRHALVMGMGMAISISSNAEVPKLSSPIGFVDNVQQTMSDIASDGRWDLYLSGHAHHSRETYSDKRLHRLNEQAWGGGFGKTLRNAQGNDESLYGMVIRDSHENLQWSAGYAYQWIFPVAGTGLEVGAGLSALLISRKDWFDRVPFPAVLPVFSVGSQNLKLMATYVPRISTKKGKGNVTLLVLKYSF
jgi:hypothetical protein